MLRCNFQTPHTRLLHCHCSFCPYSLSWYWLNAILNGSALVPNGLQNCMVVHLWKIVEKQDVESNLRAKCDSEITGDILPPNSTTAEGSWWAHRSKQCPLVLSSTIAHCSFVPFSSHFIQDTSRTQWSLLGLFQLELFWDVVTDFVLLLRPLGWRLSSGSTHKAAYHWCVLTLGEVCRALLQGK